MKSVHCLLNNEKVVLRIDKEDTVASVMERAMGLGPKVDQNLVPRLYDSEGYLLPIGPSIEENSDDNLYQLSFVAGQKGESRAPEDIKAIQNKLNHLKKFTYTAKQKYRRNPLPAVEKVNDVVKKYKLKDENLLTKRYTDDVYESLLGLEFSIWSYNSKSLAHFIGYMFEHLGLIKEFSIDEMKLSHFLQTIKACYNDNPFHNFKHCFCVTQMIFVMLNFNVFKNLSKLEILATLLSAIGHDLDHPGMNNAYQMNALTTLAITYNDSSPLENHHSAMLFAILRQPEFNILEKLTTVQYRELRKIVISCILSTDMGKHAEFLHKIREQPELDIGDAEKRLLILNLLIKCADISNEVRPTHISEPWVDLLLQEFFAQADKEKELGLPIAPFMDKTKVTKASVQGTL